MSFTVAHVRKFASMLASDKSQRCGGCMQPSRGLSTLLAREEK